MDYALAKSMKWVLAFRRLVRAASGDSLKTMQQLYCAVAIPKLTYTADVWYTPITRRREKAAVQYA